MPAELGNQLQRFASKVLQQGPQEGVDMLKAAIITLTICAALGAQTVKKVPIESTPAGDGKTMFRTYCATCHGIGGKGDGPAADALKKRPADLTQLARKNNGTFPELHVMNYITGADVIAAHGSRDMPIWGDLFKALSPNDQGVAKLRVDVLMEYVKSLQAH
jgi:mono/diheme cytochrome c family protein